MSSTGTPDDLASPRAECKRDLCARAGFDTNAKQKPRGTHASAGSPRKRRADSATLH